LRGVGGMSGLRSRRKGLRAEYQTRDLLTAAGLPARKVSGAYRPGHDLEVQVGDRMLKLEVKARSDFSTLHRWLDGADALVLRADRRAPLVVLRLSLAAEIAKPKDSG
jgi:hypothetical protein